MNTAGFGALYPIVISATVFAGSMEFVTVGLLLQAFDPVRVLMLTLMVNARHLFYGLSMLDKYRNGRPQAVFLIYGMCDETFSIHCSVDVPPDVDKGWFLLLVTIAQLRLLGAGHRDRGDSGFLGNDQHRGPVVCADRAVRGDFSGAVAQEKTHHSALLGLGSAFFCLLIFGNDTLHPAGDVRDPRVPDHLPQAAGKGG